MPAFRNWVSSEKERLTKKKQAIMKNEADKRLAELVKFSQSFKVRLPPSLFRSFIGSVWLTSYDNLSLYLVLSFVTRFAHAA